ncbi:hypothetical protein EMPS_06144 [Entomortierella parvispora]|uniref:YMC020W-like alpha/beta hydrolase domain-containing protein n=1 Tax=Entomortierella parvispora TaxID=205924 RepID=A0A9P3HBY7_9FUNG|nr:hypothetical protein EMPS_06144 [Entomortierella parvispora]
MNPGGSNSKSSCTSSPSSTHGRALVKDTASIKSSPGTLSGLDLLASAKRGPSVCASSNNSDSATILKSSSSLSLDQVGVGSEGNSASRSLESIMRKTSASSLSGPRVSQKSSASTADLSVAVTPSKMDNTTADTTIIAPSTPAIDTVQEADLASRSPPQEPAQESPLLGVVASTDDKSPMEVDPALPPQPVSNKMEPIARTNSRDTVRTGDSGASERMSSLGVLATWWSGSSSTTPASSNRIAAPDHDQGIHTQGSSLALTTTTTGSSITSTSTTTTTLASSIPATSTSPPPDSKSVRGGDSMDWEPTGPEAAFIQRTKQTAQSSSLPSSLPSSSAFPTSMLKHSKLVDAASQRRGSSPSTQGSLSTLLWSKLAASQDNLVSQGPIAYSKIEHTTEGIPTSATADSVADADVDFNRTGSLAIAPLNAKAPDSQSSSSKKRWSIFGYGSKDDDDRGAPATGRSLLRSGDVIIESESRPSSIREPSQRPDTPVSTVAPSTTDAAASPPLAMKLDGPTPMKTEFVEAIDEGGAIAPATVGTSELSVVVPPGAAIMASKANSNDNSNGALSNSSSWLAMIPGFSSKADGVAPIWSSHQVTDYEEGERKDINGSSIKLEAQPSGRTFAQMTEARNSKESLSVKSNASGGAREGQTFAQLKERESKENGLVEEAGRAAASLSKVILKKKNMVLPNYYEQFPDVRQSLLTIPIGQMDVPMDSPKHARSGSIVKSAVNALSSLLFSKPPTAHQDAPLTSDEALHRGASGIQKVVIIGIHGWFPVKLIRTVIGEPTGTSKKFCDEMGLALKDYLKLHNVELKPENISLIPLEGEGKVLNRVEILYQNLVKNEEWKNALHEADLVLVATHSQGTPTSTILIARLIDEGLLRVKEHDPKMQRVGILAMAGISHGPFPSLKGNLIVRWFEAEAAQELFEFMDSETDIAKKYREALRTVLTSGVRFTCVASLEDQVVPLYSAVMTSIHHPSIVRAVYIDGASFQDDFLTNLISFSMRLRNSGVDDHGVLVHLSEVVAGSIYGEGHSTIYEEREVYLLAIRSLLEPPSSLTSEMARSEPILHPFKAKQTLNPFYLPWGMRGVMDELKARGDQVLDDEMERLKKLYDDWRPVSKGMKEIKFRLEPVRSKL